MASIKVILFKGKVYSDGTNPIMLQSYIDGKVKRMVIAKCYPKDWDPYSSRVRPKTANSIYLNNLILEKYTECERRLYQYLVNEDGSANILAPDSVPKSVLEAVQTELDSLKRELKMSAYLRLKALHQFLLDNPQLSQIKASCIDLIWFQRLVAELKLAGNGNSTILKKVKTIRSIISRFSGKPLSEDVRVFRIPVSKPIKEKLSATEVELIEQVDLSEGSIVGTVRDIFLLQIYLRGSRVGALIRAYSNQFTDGRYEASNGDSRKNNVSCKLIPKAQAIVDRYKDKYERLFPLFNWQDDPKKTTFENRLAEIRHRDICILTINKNLKEIAAMVGIKKHISSHIARHTFARMAIDKIKNPMVTMDLLGHKSLAVHQQYLKDVQNDEMLDDMTDEIFS